MHLPARDAVAPWPSFIHYREPFAAYGLETPGEGVKLGEHHAGAVVTDPDGRRGRPERGERATARVRGGSGSLASSRSRPPTRTCLYTSTPTEDFVIDRVGPVVICSPCSGHGFKFAPVVGELVADLADGSPAPERFRLDTQGMQTLLPLSVTAPVSSVWATTVSSRPKKSRGW